MRSPYGLEMENLIGVHHVSLNVDDLDATTSFYRDVLGLEVLDRPDDDIAVDGTWLGLPDGRELHLLVSPVAENKGQHFAFEVHDIEGVVDQLAEAGVSTRSVTAMEGICRQTFCTDPSGNLVEFNERS